MRQRKIDKELSTDKVDLQGTAKKAGQSKDEFRNAVCRSERIVSAVLWICRLLGCALFAYGMYLARNKLCTHEECDMTYSMRMFLELDIPKMRSPKAHGYRLFKFIDQRDPRHSTFMRQKQPLAGHEWCLDPLQTMPVLFVPGHGGSYQQSRSLGAHGIQLTASQDMFQQRRVLQALRNNLWTGNATTLGSFVYDVYALDFQEEGAGLHGNLVEHQSAIIADAIQFLSETCHFEHITIVAHSIGGYATKLALMDYPHVQTVVRNVITLATPHAHPVLAIEPSIHRIHARLRQHSISNYSNTALVSIGGGLRDEMIPPHSCHAATEAASFLNVAAVDIMPPGQKTPPMLGMDHRAIVWCYNLLLSVRQILFILNESVDKDASERIRRVADGLQLSSDYDYLASVDQSRTVFAKSFGVWQSRLIEMGLLYSLEHLVGLFSLSSALYVILGLSPWSSLAILPLASVIVRFNAASMSYPFSWGCTCILCLVANTVFVLLHVGIEKASAIAKKFASLEGLSFAVAAFALASAVTFLVLFAHPGNQMSAPYHFTSQIFILALAPTTILLHIRWNAVCPDSTKCCYLSWMIVVIPLLSTGLFYVTLMRQRQVPVFDSIVTLFPVLLSLFLSESSRGRLPILCFQNLTRMMTLCGASTLINSPGMVTLQIVLLLPSFACIDAVFVASKFFASYRRWNGDEKSHKNV